MATLNDVKAKQAELLTSVQSETTLVQSVKTLLEGQNAMIASLKQQLQDAINAGGNPAELQAIVDALGAIITTNEANKQATADAVIANTPPAIP